MSMPAPHELIEKYGPLTPEQMALALGLRVQRLQAPPALTGVTVLSAFEPEQTIILYQQPLKALAKQRKEPLTRLEQWHIAHELYHALSEADGCSTWRLRETEADMWADELVVLGKK